MKKRIEIIVEMEARASKTVLDMIDKLGKAMFAWKNWHDAKGKGKRKIDFIMKENIVEKEKKKPKIKGLEVSFFNNGSTFVSQDGKQIDESPIQKGWFSVFLGFLESKGIDPKDVEFTLPDGKQAKVFKAMEGTYNWHIERVK